MKPETQAFFVEALKPSESQLLARAARDLTRGLDDRSRDLTRLLHALEDVEENPEIVGRVDGLLSRFRALQKQVDEMNSTVRQILRTEDEVGRIVREMISHAEDAQKRSEVTA